MKDCDPYVGNSRKVWKGRALVVIKGNRNAGDIRLIFSSQGLINGTINIKTN